jgi:hypothetical protein
MPVHDWTLVEDGTWHAFHSGWITHLSEALNEGVLPHGYYALSEQHSLTYIGDVLTLHAPEDSPFSSPESGGVSVLEAPPKVSVRLSAQPSYQALRRTLVIRRTTGHRVVALVEILSPGNKNGPKSVQQFIQKAADTLKNGCHLLLVDLFPPGKSNPKGMHGAIWDWLMSEATRVPKARPLTLASYEARRPRLELYLEHLAVGQEMPEMPLFLRPGYYVNIPLQPTYDQAFRGMPAIYRALLTKGANGKRPKRGR